jgi:hypothetical protein
MCESDECLRKRARYLKPIDISGTVKRSVDAIVGR